MSSHFPITDSNLLTVGKLTKAGDKNFMSALFNIFDSDNDGYFGLDDLITLLRSFEKNRIVPQLNKPTLRHASSSTSDSSGGKTDVESGNSSKEVETISSSEDLPETVLDSQPYFSSKKIKSIAKKMLKNSGFDSKSLLDITDFSGFMNDHMCFQNAMYLAMKPELWSEVDMKKVNTRDPANVNAFERKTKMYLSEGRPKHISRKSQSFNDNLNENGVGFFSNRIHPQIEGILRKKGRKCGTLKKRHYYIKDNVMYYYSKKRDSVPSGIMYLPNKLFKQAEVNGKHCIKIFTYDSSFEHKCFYASSEAECDEWYEAMLKASNNPDITMKFRMKETLGVGKFSTVRKAYSKRDESYSVAIKIVSKKSLTPIEMEYILNEVSILKTIHHPGVPKVLGIHETPEKLFIVMELIKGGELFDYLVESKSLKVEEATDVLYSLLKVLKYLKELKVMHRDVKTENILITKDKRAMLKKIYLTDFGLARYVDSREKVTNKLGTLGYCAPEVILKEPYNEAVDVWGAGMVYYLLLTGKLPFDDKSNSVIVEKTVKSPLPLQHKAFNDVDTHVTKFLDRACQKNPSDRMTIEECITLCASIKI